jgi:hypothetical protein
MAERVRDLNDARRRDGRLRRPRPPTPAQQTQLTDTARGAPDPGGSTEDRGLTCHHRREQVNTLNTSMQRRQLRLDAQVRLRASR